MTLSIIGAIKDIECIFHKYNLTPIEIIYICEILKHTEIQEVIK